jgi:hypothetical protein
MSAVSRRFRAHDGIRSDLSAISLCLRFAKTNLRLASNRCGSSTQSDPTIYSIATSIMITSSNSPGKGSGMPNHTAVIYCNRDFIIVFHCLRSLERFSDGTSKTG